MDESRKQFEDWFHSRYDSISMPPKDRVNLFTFSWAAWQASLAVIELDIDWPEANDDTWMEGEDGVYARGHEDGKDKVVIAVRQAIRAAGIKVKE